MGPCTSRAALPSDLRYSGLTVLFHRNFLLARWKVLRPSVGRFRGDFELTRVIGGVKNDISDLLYYF